MSVTESCDSAVRIEISRYTVPSRKSVVGAELHHAKGHLRSGISVAGKVGTDKRIYISCGICIMTVIDRSG